MSKNAVLLILDGWGHSDNKDWNAIAQGATPVFDRLDKEVPKTLIQASGEDVGLPKGQMGNSEVGHLNMGSGRVVYQELLRVSRAIEEGSFFENSGICSVFDSAASKETSVHLLGLVSDGGVHSHLDHLVALLKMAKGRRISKIFVHCFMDGRDTPPDSGLGYIKALEEQMKIIGAGRIASIQGRFYAMDRDNRWERTSKAFDLLVHHRGAEYSSAVAVMEDNYSRGITDEFIEPSLITENGAPVGWIMDGDEVLMFNFRADRMRQIVRTLYDPSFAEFHRGALPRIDVTCLTEYDARFPLPVVFDSHPIENGLGEVLAEHGMTQFRTAETEKYAHVTFFFNGGVETPNPGEERKLIPSPKVRTYDMKPQMSCKKVADSVIGAVKSGKYPLIVANLANGDMVGHTGVWEAAVAAVETVDKEVGRILEACKEAGSELIITSDHGNIECMVDDNGKPMTAHTTNPVPLYYLGGTGMKLREGGALKDVAPTVLKLMGIPQPEEMTGESLLE
ncbi:MAG: 2,3-bisphosphoglycerate-independent phosphoglycerate mutase [Nitrospinota bacterium]|nr:2,3-bisphosphoglycerate-independent phosphoglycerate mutase [Nitrospinota bacterium]MDH5756335.1 2,3-bisphosphoglycerate-independent phosphoglycerate mutase [Nitrospinota bacterium]